MQKLPKIYSGVTLCFFFYKYCLATSIMFDIQFWGFNENKLVNAIIMILLFLLSSND